MKIGCLLSIRNKATRLPQKSVLDILGSPLITALLKRLCLAEEVDQIVVSTSTNADDAILETLATQQGFQVYRGSEQDKLDRYYRTAQHFGFDAVIIVDGDDLLCFPEGITEIAKTFRQTDYDAISLSNLPVGAAATGLRTRALENILNLKDEEDTEVWGGYFFNSGYFNTQTLHLAPELSDSSIRLTLDYPEDYTFLQAIFNSLNSIDFTSYQLMDLLVNVHPSLLMINESAKEKYQHHLLKAAPVKFHQRESLKFCEELTA